MATEVSLVKEELKKELSKYFSLGEKSKTLFSHFQRPGYEISEIEKLLKEAREINVETLNEGEAMELLKVYTSRNAGTEALIPIAQLAWKKLEEERSTRYERTFIDDSSPTVEERVSDTVEGSIVGGVKGVANGFYDLVVEPPYRLLRKILFLD